MDFHGLKMEPTECVFCGKSLALAPNHAGAHDACWELANEFMHDASNEWERGSQVMS
jgi:hypothetical protein